MPELSRRRALTAAAALAATAGAATVVASGAAADANAASVAATTPDAAGHDHGHASPAPFDEVYKGRRIQGRPVTGGGHQHHGGGYAVFVDGAELHVMRNADGTWISVVTHYDPVATPRAAARAAVDELQGAKLVPFAAN
ncbi:tyrosinase cofactor [Streptomyces spinoverrucosus]|uniref:apotyrosinase chaperone MelC1 n=1 Tax=Streptomyces spinoverrucosus TaxID=284043 RepID=UPI0018C386B4|nr:tyrosinase cofactor [Streptomyces spinoverrucosus]MBG0857528.1 tyrosinase cofactor [Streptomyces spinoverrucosus]